ncbi:MAG: hypothetical protein Q8P67_20750 [archaeon]|nr:hypothetical protein [archaeon]
MSSHQIDAALLQGTETGVSYLEGRSEVPDTPSPEKRCCPTLARGIHLCPRFQQLFHTSRMAVGTRHHQTGSSILIRALHIHTCT